MHFRWTAIQLSLQWTDAPPSSMMWTGHKLQENADASTSSVCAQITMALWSWMSVANCWRVQWNRHFQPICRKWKIFANWSKYTDHQHWLNCQCSLPRPSLAIIYWDWGFRWRIRMPIYTWLFSFSYLDSLGNLRLHQCLQFYPHGQFWKC